MSNYHCRVCGLEQEEEDPWDPPTWGYCSCCGIQFGISGDTLDDVRFYRAYWIEHGAQWFRPDEKPEDWSLEEQMKNISEKWR